MTQPPARPQVTLNHLYLVLDSATLAAVESSAFLANEFSHYRKATTQSAGGRQWTGTNLFGERTYLELYSSGVQGPVGLSGVALSVEQPGALDSVVTWLRGAFDVPIRRRLVEGVRAGRSFPWFHSVSVDHSRGDSLRQVYSWIMEIHPDFYRVVQQDTTGPVSDISRKRYLKRRYQPERMVREIVGVSLALHPQIAIQFGSELKALGWAVEGSAEPGRFRALGPDADIVVVPIAPGDHFGIRELRFALNRGPTALRIHQLGSSRLELCPTQARWTFGVSAAAVLPPPLSC